jgi:hypothetical protein
MLAGFAGLGDLSALGNGAPGRAVAISAIVPAALALASWLAGRRG